MSADQNQQAWETRARDVAVLPPAGVEAVVGAGGFERPVPLYQAGLLHTWIAARASLSMRASVDAGTRQAAST